MNPAGTQKTKDQERDEVLRRMLKTPPKKHEPLGKRKPRKDKLSRPEGEAGTQAEITSGEK